jgi:AAA family ATP:ADP antiporter
LLSGLLVAPIGPAGLLLLSAGLLLASLACVSVLLRWRAAHNPCQQAEEDPGRAMGGSMWAGLTLISRSPYLVGISLFVLLLTSVSTFLYFEQARLVEATFPDPTRQTQLFSAIDATVQALTILIQLFVTGQLAKKLGITVLLTAVPLAMVAGFGALAVAATFPVLVAVILIRRVGEYALARPGREMLFAPVDPETKYKAKNAIDTVVYRGGDAVSAWLKAGIDAISTGPAAAAIAGAGIAAAWAVTGYRLGRGYDSRAR